MSSGGWAARHDRTRAAHALAPGDVQPVAAEDVTDEAGVGGNEDAASPDGRGRENSTGSPHRLQLPVRRAEAPAEARKAEQPELGVLATLDGETVADERRRRAPEIDVAALEARLVAGCPAVQQAARGRGQHQGAVSPVAAAVEASVAGRDEQIARAGNDDDARTGPDRRVALRAAFRVQQPVDVRAQRVPDVRDAPARRVDRHRPAIGRRHEEGVVPVAVHPDAAQIDRRGIDRTVEDDALLLELAYVGRRDPGPGRARVVAGRVIAEAGPVPTELGRRSARLHRGAGARAAANREEPYEP